MSTQRVSLFSGTDAGGDLLVAWAESTRRRQVVMPCRGGLRFAFYGRVSTEDYQDPITSRMRQRDQASALVAGHGRIVAELFDVGQSRVLPWPRRPQGPDTDSGAPSPASRLPSQPCRVLGLATPVYSWDVLPCSGRIPGCFPPAGPASGLAVSGG
jgi:hypothetical protein